MNDTSTLDDRTATAIREAMLAVRAGRISDAVAIGERALADGGDPTALNAMVGSLLCRSGKPTDGIRHLKAAHQGKPEDAIIASNLASALAETGDHDGAVGVLGLDLAKADPTQRLLRMRGFFAQTAGNFPVAIESYSAVVDADPLDWETWNNLGNAQVDNGDLTDALASLRKAAELNPRAAPTRLNLCRTLQDLGEFTEAEAQLRSMADDFPDDAKPLVDLHDLLQQQGRDEELAEILDRALQREPDDLLLLLARARHRLDSHDMEAAETAFRDVLARDPANADAFVGLALVREHANPELLDSLVEEAIAADVAAPALNLVRAFADRRAKRYREGLTALEAVPADYEPSRRAHIEGQLRDALGDYDGAFAAFERMNEAFAADPSQPLQRAEMVRDRVRDNLAKATPEWVASWSAPAIEAERTAPVFLVGFPRSGTTLLDTMLMGHPDVAVMEERPVLSQVEREIGGFDAIAKLSDKDVREAQDKYFAIAGRYADIENSKLLIDKSPLALNRALLIHRLFPNAKIILAIRHPADVLLSCFMASFRLNSSMSNFLRLDSAAKFYDLTFRFWENARSLVEFDVLPVRYEQMVEDAEAELKPVLDALGLEWDSKILDHQRTAQERGVISTASYAQVTQPLYQSSIGRWENYRRQFEPILPVLQPWIDKFGYGD